MLTFICFILFAFIYFHFMLCILFSSASMLYIMASVHIGSHISWTDDVQGIYCPAEGGEVQCALCQTVSSTTVHHPLLEDIMRESQERAGLASRCGQCAERGSPVSAAGSCIQCGTNLCRDCIQAHKITRATWGHEVKMMTEAEQEDMCTLHGQVIDNYCDTCEQLCCRDCILSSHRVHQSRTLEAKVAELRAAMLSSLEGVRNVKATIDQNITELKGKLAEFDTEKRRGFEHIRDAYEQYQQTTGSFFMRQLEFLRRQHDVYRGGLLERLQADSLADARAGHLCNLVGRLIESTRPSTVMHYCGLISNLSGRLLMVTMQEEKLKEPRLTLRRVLGIDRIGDCMSVLLYWDKTCVQPREKINLCRRYMSASCQTISAQARADPAGGMMFVLPLLRAIALAPTASPHLRSLIRGLHRTAITSLQEQPVGLLPEATPARTADQSRRVFESWPGQNSRLGERQEGALNRQVGEEEPEEPAVQWSGAEVPPPAGGSAPATIPWSPLVRPASPPTADAQVTQPPPQPSPVPSETHCLPHPSAQTSAWQPQETTVNMPFILSCSTLPPSPPPAAATESSDTEFDLFVDSKVDVFENVLKMEPDCGSPELTEYNPAPEGPTHVPTRPAAVPTRSAARSAVPTEPVPAPAGSLAEPAWKASLREKAHRVAKRRAERSVAASEAGPPAKRVKVRVLAARRGVSRDPKRTKRRKKADAALVGGNSAPKAREELTRKKGDHVERGSGEHADRSNAERNLSKEHSDKEPVKADHQGRDDSQLEGTDHPRKQRWLPSPEARDPQSATCRQPPAAQPRSLLVDDHGRKISKAGVSVDTSMTDLLDSMLLAGATAAPSSAEASNLAPTARDKFILEHCAPRGQERRPPPATSVQLDVEEPAERVAATPRTAERQRTEKRPAWTSLMSDLALSDDSSMSSNGEPTSRPTSRSASRPTSRSASRPTSRSASRPTSRSSSTSASTSSSSSSSGSSSSSAAPGPAARRASPAAHRPRPSTSTSVRTLPEFAATPPPSAVRPRFSPPPRAAAAPLPAHLVRAADGSRWDRAADPLGIGFAPEALYRPPERGPGTPNVSYCVLCWDGGDLVLCDSCERSFHAECYLASVEDNADGQWQCLMCSEMPDVPAPVRPRAESGLSPAELCVAQRLLLELYAAYYPSLYFRNKENMSTLSELTRVANPVCLDDIKDRLLKGGFGSLMDFLKSLRHLMVSMRVLNKASAAKKYLKELEEVFDLFVCTNLNDHWLLLDDASIAQP